MTGRAEGIISSLSLSLSLSLSVCVFVCVVTNGPGPIRLVLSLSLSLSARARACVCFTDWASAVCVFVYFDAWACVRSNSISSELSSAALHPPLTDPRFRVGTPLRSEEKGTNLTAVGPLSVPLLGQSCVVCVGLLC